MLLEYIAISVLIAVATLMALIAIGLGNLLGPKIEIRGFGSFVVRDYGGYKGRNPKTGEIVAVLPKKLPFFKVGKELKEMVNTGQGLEALPVSLLYFFELD